MHLSVQQATQQLQQAGSLFLEVFRHGSLSVEVYKPKDVDLQQPHPRDEVYVIMSGKGTFNLAGQRYLFQPGDFLFVPAGVEHRFEDFSGDFSTWVLFYGPEGGEKPTTNG